MERKFPVKFPFLLSDSNKLQPDLKKERASYDFQFFVNQSDLNTSFGIFYGPMCKQMAFSPLSPVCPKSKYRGVSFQIYPHLMNFSHALLANYRQMDFFGYPKMRHSHCEASVHRSLSIVPDDALNTTCAQASNTTVPMRKARIIYERLKIVEIKVDQDSMLHNLVVEILI